MKKKIGILLLSLGFASVSSNGQNNITVFDENTNQNEVIDLPEGMSSDIDELLHEWNVKNYLTPNENCESSKDNPEFDKDTYINRLSRLPNVIEMPYNEVVHKFIDHYCTKLRRSVSFMLGASNFYTPIFEEALESYQLPLELKYLPVIESALNPQAASHAGAVGLWQFMLTTGKKYGLEVNSLIDERKDPIKASYAAARYLRDLYSIYNDWALAIAAYNCGPGNVNKAIKRAGDSKDYWEIYPYLPQETRGYVPAFIAANYVMNYYCEHHICPVNAVLPASTDTLHISKPLHFEQVVAMCNVSMEEVKALNPQYRTGLIPGNTVNAQILRLPTPSISAFITAGDSIYNYNSDELFTNRKVAEVKKASVTKPKPTYKRNSRKKSTGGKYATIRKGDSLSEIAARNHTTVKKLRQLNGIKGNSIRAGKKIRVR